MQRSIPKGPRLVPLHAVAMIAAGLLGAVGAFALELDDMGQGYQQLQSYLHTIAAHVGTRLG